MMLNNWIEKRARDMGFIHKDEVDFEKIGFPIMPGQTFSMQSKLGFLRKIRSSVPSDIVYFDYENLTSDVIYLAICAKEDKL